MEDDFSLKVVLPPGDITHFRKEKIEVPLFINSSKMGSQYKKKKPHFQLLSFDMSFP